MSKIKVIIADDSDFVRDGMKIILDPKRRTLTFVSRTLKN